MVGKEIELINWKVESIVVIAVSEKDFFRSQWKWMGGFLVPGGHLYLTSQVHSGKLG